MARGGLKKEAKKIVKDREDRIKHDWLTALNRPAQEAIASTKIPGVAPAEVQTVLKTALNKGKHISGAGENKKEDWYLPTGPSTRDILTGLDRMETSGEIKARFASKLRTALKRPWPEYNSAGEKKK